MKHYNILLISRFCHSFLWTIFPWLPQVFKVSQSRNSTLFLRFMTGYTSVTSYIQECRVATTNNTDPTDHQLFDNNLTNWKLIQRSFFSYFNHQLHIFSINIKWLKHKKLKYFLTLNINNITY